MATAYNPDPIYAGDTWPGIPAITLTLDGIPPVFALASARLVFFKNGQPAGKSPATGITLASPSTITIVSAANWSMLIPPQILPLDPGEWTFQFKTTDAAGTVQTWFAGTLTIL